MIGGSIFLSRETLLSLYGVVSGAEGSLEALEMQAATTQLLYVALPYFLCGLMEVGSGILRGLGKSSLAMIIYVIGTCVLRIVWLETVFPLFVTLEAIYICYGISWIVTSLTLYAIGFFEIKKAIRKKRAEDKLAQ
jgi:Na+-driven multidrug efflux pump